MKYKYINAKRNNQKGATKLTRADYRREQKAQQKKKKSYNLTREQLERSADVAIEDKVKEIKLEVITFMQANMALALNEEYNFGSIRVQRVIDRMAGYSKDFANDRLEYQDVLSWINEKGIELR